jgi:CBS domain-containing protein
VKNGDEEAMEDERVSPVIEVGRTVPPAPFLPVLVRDVMTREPITVEPSATVKDIAHTLLDRDIRCVPVVDVGDILIGVVSESDLICREGYPTVRSHHLSELIEGTVTEHRHHWSARAEGVTAGEIMTSDFVTCRPDEPVAIVTRRMLRLGVRTLPVVDKDRLVGVVSRHDLLRLFDRPDSEIRERIEQLLADPLWAPREHSAEFSVRDGVVVLSGSARSESDVSVLLAHVRQVPGVIEVVNRMSARGPNPKSKELRPSDWH